ncbi:Senescence-specific cysteine protease SAG12 [Forsythia ovata]|uniref:Senescence-specific cysteine protease SAG12 n=1 Tax=Forsythia ovata TaxID=205694 RepID=A0ABD1PKY0_9LAMI
MDYAFEFIINNHGLKTGSNYPYKGIDGTCNTQASHPVKITGYEDVPVDSESALLKVVANQPVSVTIDASGSKFQFYKSGVFIEDCETDLDHGVTAVGYGTSEDGAECLYLHIQYTWYIVGAYVGGKRGERHSQTLFWRNTVRAF